MIRLWKKQVRPVARSCRITEMSSKRRSLPLIGLSLKEFLLGPAAHDWPDSEMIEVFTDQPLAVRVMDFATECRNGLPSGPSLLAPKL
jgi:hypothetical protein